MANITSRHNKASLSQMDAVARLGRNQMSLLSVTGSDHVAHLHVSIDEAFDMRLKAALARITRCLFPIPLAVAFSNWAVRLASANMAQLFFRHHRAGRVA